MKKAALQGVPVAERARPGATRSLPYGLRELAPLPPPRIFCGMLTTTDDRLLLQAAEHPYFLDVCSSLVVDSRLHEKKVSVLGCLGEPTQSVEAAGRSIVAMKIVSHEAVSRRAYEIHESRPDCCAIENWLRAQQELLEH